MSPFDLPDPVVKISWEDGEAPLPSIAWRIRGLSDPEADLELAMVCLECGAVLSDHRFNREETVDMESLNQRGRESGAKDRARALRHIQEECSPPRLGGDPDDINHGGASP
jgi:hypothetical protein